MMGSIQHEYRIPREIFRLRADKAVRLGQHGEAGGFAGRRSGRSKPHQVEAALFAFRSPLSKGAILADEVGLGKTIEAGDLGC